MWIVETDAQRAAREAAQAEATRRMLEDAARKNEARDAWLRLSTCEHCGQHPPLPPWLI